MSFRGKRRDRAACAEARDAELLGTADAGTLARVSRHVARCPACQAERTRLEGLRADVRTEPAPLDDLTRARMLDRLIPALDDLAAGRARLEPRRQPRSPATRWLPLAGVAVAAGALAVALWPALPWHAPVPGNADRSDRASATGPIARIAPPPAAPVPDPLALVQPDSGGPDPRAPGVRRLVVGEGARQTARLGERTHLLLVGPAELEVVSASPQLLEVRLARGTLVGHYRHGAPGRLRVLSPGTRTDVVGTTFYVEARADSSRVAVARGRVLVRGGDEEGRLVSAGQLWTSPAADASPPAPGAEARGQADQAPGSGGGVLTSKLPRPIVRLFADQARGEARSGDGREPTAPPSPADPGTTAPPPAPATGATAADLYRRAEQAMARGDQAEARRRLLELAAVPQAGALGAVATYELAQLALRAGDLAEARARLERLPGSEAPQLVEPAAFLLCEVDLRAGAREEARRCYARFRAHHPGSVQDAEALGALLRVSPSSADCSSGRALLDEYLTRYPDGPLAQEARQRRAPCEP